MSPNGAAMSPGGPNISHEPAAEDLPARSTGEAVTQEFLATTAKDAADALGGVARITGDIVGSGTIEARERLLAKLEKDAPELRRQLDHPSEETDYDRVARIFDDISHNRPTPTRAQKETQLALVEAWLESTRQSLEADRHPQGAVASVLRPVAEEIRQQVSKKSEAVADYLAETGDYAQQFYGADPDDQSVAAQMGRGAGHVFVMTPALLSGNGGVAITAAASLGASQSYADAYNSTAQDLRGKGVTDPEMIADLSQQAASVAAVKTAPALAAYLVGGRLSAEVVGRLLPKATAPILRWIAGGTAATGANVATSSILRVVDGQDWRPNAESLTQDVLYGVSHSVATATSKASGSRAGKIENATPASTERTGGSVSPVEIPGHKLSEQSPALGVKQIKPAEEIGAQSQPDSSTSKLNRNDRAGEFANDASRVEAVSIKRVLTVQDLGIRGSVLELKATLTVKDGVALVRVDMIKAKLDNPFRIIKNLIELAKSHGARTLHIEGTLANEKLYRVLEKKYGIVTDGTNETITFNLNEPFN
jgi:hypothetical protein